MSGKLTDHTCWGSCFLQPVAMRRLDAGGSYEEPSPGVHGFRRRGPLQHDTVSPGLCDHFPQPLHRPQSVNK